MKNWLPAMVVIAALAIGCSSPDKAPDTASKTTSSQGGGRDRKPTRLAIKRATDDAAGKASTTPTKTTIEDMMKVARPDGLAEDDSTPEFQDKRVAPFETTIWQVDATVTQVVKRRDGDFFLTIEGAKGGKSVVEVPDPALCKDSKKLAEITATRKAIEDKFHPTDKPQKVNVKAKFTGFGFFGFSRAREGQPASNGARIMPGLKVEWS